MKITELLTEKEIQEIYSKNYYGIINTDQIEYHIEKHILELEIKDYMLYKIYEQLEAIKIIMENTNE